MVGVRYTRAGDEPCRCGLSPSGGRALDIGSYLKYHGRTGTLGAHKGAESSRLTRPLTYQGGHRRGSGTSRRVVSTGPNRDERAKNCGPFLTRRVCAFFRDFWGGGGGGIRCGSRDARVV